MPSTITHTYIGLDILDRLNNSPKKIISNSIEDYKTFCSSMDILYFYKINLFKSNIYNKVGKTFHHTKTNEVFNYLIDYCKKNKSDEIFTLLCGLITHYVADSTIHPFVNSFSNGSKLERTDKHFEIETYFDKYMLKEKNCYNKFYKLQFNNKKNDEVIKVLNDLFSKVYHIDNVGVIYYKALNTMKNVFKYLRYDKTGFKKFLYKIVDLNNLDVRRSKYLSYHFNIDDVDKYLNRDKKEWCYPMDKSIVYNYSFDELYEIVINKSINIINNLYEYIYNNKDIDIDKLLENRNYSSGLVLKKSVD